MCVDCNYGAKSNVYLSKCLFYYLLAYLAATSLRSNWSKNYFSRRLCAMMRRLCFQFVLFHLWNCILVHGATIVAARCKNGIVLAADSLSTSGSNVVISSRSRKKVFMLTKSTLICSASNTPKGDTDFQYLYNKLKNTVSSHEAAFESSLSTSAVAKVARQLMTTPECSKAHIVIAGWGEQPSPSTLMSDQNENCEDSCKYVLCEILPGGSRMDSPVVVAGSGSSLIATLVEENMQNTPVESLTSSIDKRSDHPKLSDQSVLSSATSNVKLPFTQLTVAQVIPQLKQSLQLASRLDPQTGGDKFQIWYLSK